MLDATHGVTVQSDEHDELIPEDFTKVMLNSNENPLRRSARFINRLGV